MSNFTVNRDHSYKKFVTIHGTCFMASVWDLGDLELAGALLTLFIAWNFTQSN